MVMEGRWPCWTVFDRRTAFCLLTAHRDQSSSKKSRAGFRAPKLSLWTVSTPSQAFAQWSVVETEASLPLRGQRRRQTGFPIIPPAGFAGEHLERADLITDAAPVR